MPQDVIQITSTPPPDMPQTPPEAQDLNPVQSGSMTLPIQTGSSGTLSDDLIDEIE